ncbi:MAG: DUF5671 domain-containing protein [Actinomycetota bacterium]
MTTHPKVGPKDVFLWLGAMISLYASAISFLGLLFAYVNYLFPDVTQGYYYDEYYDPYSGAVRTAMAFLIVSVPTFLVLTRMLNADLRTHPEKEEIWVRKWAIVATIFVASVTIAIDLVTLVQSFLGGELQTRFLLKVLAVLVVAGGGLWYYLEDLRGLWRRNATAARATGIGAAALIVVTVLGGFLVIGSPMTQRLYRLDAQKVSDLQVIQSQLLYAYYQAKRELPPTLDALDDPTMGFQVPVDQETGEPYGYRVTGDLSFQLCATFNEASRERQGAPRFAEGGVTNDTWRHDAGEYCFDRTVDPAFFPVK